MPNGLFCATFVLKYRIWYQNQNNGISNKNIHTEIGFSDRSSFANHDFWIMFLRKYWQFDAR